MSECKVTAKSASRDGKETRATVIQDFFQDMKGVSAETAKVAGVIVDYDADPIEVQRETLIRESLEEAKFPNKLIQMISAYSADTIYGEPIKFFTLLTQSDWQLSANKAIQELLKKDCIEAPAQSGVDHLGWDQLQTEIIRGYRIEYEKFPSITRRTDLDEVKAQVSKQFGYNDTPDENAANEAAEATCQNVMGLPVLIVGSALTGGINGLKASCALTYDFASTDNYKNYFRGDNGKIYFEFMEIYTLRYRGIDDVNEGPRSICLDKNGEAIQALIRVVASVEKTGLRVCMFSIGTVTAGSQKFFQDAFNVNLLNLSAYISEITVLRSIDPHVTQECSQSNTELLLSGPLYRDKLDSLRHLNARAKIALSLHIIQSQTTIALLDNLVKECQREDVPLHQKIEQSRIVVASLESVVQTSVDAKQALIEAKYSKGSIEALVLEEKQIKNLLVTYKDMIGKSEALITFGDNEIKQLQGLILALNNGIKRYKNDIHMLEQTEKDLVNSVSAAEEKMQVVVHELREAPKQKPRHRHTQSCINNGEGSLFTTASFASSSTPPFSSSNLTVGGPSSLSLRPRSHSISAILSQEQKVESSGSQPPSPKSPQSPLSFFSRNFTALPRSPGSSRRNSIQQPPSQTNARASAATPPTGNIGSTLSSNEEKNIAALWMAAGEEVASSASQSITISAHPASALATRRKISSLQTQTPPTIPPFILATPNAYSFPVSTNAPNTVAVTAVSASLVPQSVTALSSADSSSVAASTMPIESSSAITAVEDMPLHPEAPYDAGAFEKQRDHLVADRLAGILPEKIITIIQRYSADTIEGRPIPIEFSHIWTQEDLKQSSNLEVTKLVQRNYLERPINTDHIGWSQFAEDFARKYTLEYENIAAASTLTEHELKEIVGARFGRLGYPDDNSTNRCINNHSQNISYLPELIIKSALTAGQPLMATYVLSYNANTTMLNYFKGDQGRIYFECRVPYEKVLYAGTDGTAKIICYGKTDNQPIQGVVGIIGVVEDDGVRVKSIQIDSVTQDSFRFFSDAFMRSSINPSDYVNPRALGEEVGAKASLMSFIFPRKESDFLFDVRTIKGKSELQIEKLEKEKEQRLKSIESLKSDLDAKMKKDKKSHVIDKTKRRQQSQSCDLTAISQLFREEKFELKTIEDKIEKHKERIIEIDSALEPLYGAKAIIEEKEKKAADALWKKMQEKTKLAEEEEKKREHEAKPKRRHRSTQSCDFTNRVNSTINISASLDLNANNSPSSTAVTVTPSAAASTPQNSLSRPNAGGHQRSTSGSFPSFSLLSLFSHSPKPNATASLTTPGSASLSSPTASLSPPSLGLDSHSSIAVVANSSAVLSSSQYSPSNVSGREHTRSASASPSPLSLSDTSSLATSAFSSLSANVTSGSATIPSLTPQRLRSANRLPRSPFTTTTREDGRVIVHHRSTSFSEKYNIPSADLELLRPLPEADDGKETDDNGSDVPSANSKHT